MYNTTNGRAHNNSTACCIQHIHYQRTKICNIPTSWHVEILGSGIARVQQSCTTASNEKGGFDHVIDDARKNDSIVTFTVYNGGDATDETIFYK